ncbi:MAG: hypothetical protein WC061_02760 [Melioribacteraceae bacterium]
MSETINYHYKLEFAGGKEMIFDINLDKDTLANLDEQSNLPEWTKRESFGCTNSSCPLLNHETCHIAKVVHKQIHTFKNIVSTEPVNATLTTDERTFNKKCSIQTAVASITGILMATCGCPVLSKLKPMVRFHLPFASLEETGFRVFSMYFLAQYLRGRKKLSQDQSMHSLKVLYDEIQEINMLAARKIQELERSDATINGLVILYSFGQFVSFELEENSLPELENLFRDWLV